MPTNLFFLYKRQKQNTEEKDSLRKMARDDEKEETNLTIFIIVCIIAVLVWYGLHSFWRKFPFSDTAEWKPWINVYGGQGLSGVNKGSYFCQTKAAMLGDAAEFGVGLFKSN